MNLKGALRVWQRNFTVYTKLYKSSIVLNFAEPVLYLLAFGLGLGPFVKEIKGMPYLDFIAPGIVASSVFAATYECTYGTYVRMTYQKTFEAILATPIGVDELIAGEMLWGATKTAFYGTIIMAVIAAFGLVGSPLIFLAIPAVFLSGLIFAEISVIFTALVPGIDSFNYFYTLFITPMFFFSGVFFPLDEMSPVVEKAAFFTPLYHTVNVIRSFSAGSPALWDVAWIAAVSVLLAPYPFRLMRKRVLK